MNYSFTLADTVTEGDRQRIVDTLIAYNESKTGSSAYRPLAITLADENGKVVGGLLGATAYGWLLTQQLVVPEQARGKGVGTRLMNMAEKEARARGCHGAWLDTHGFQARGFYEKLGYRSFGELPDYPVGYSRVFMSKPL